MWKVFLFRRENEYDFFFLEIKYQEVLHFHIFMVCYRVFQMDWGHFKELLILNISSPLITFMVEKFVCTYSFWKCSSLINVTKSILSTLYNIYSTHFFSQFNFGIHMSSNCCRVKYIAYYTNNKQKNFHTITLILKKGGK